MVEFTRPRRVIRTMQDAMKPDAFTELTQLDKKTEPVTWLVIHIALEILNSKENYFLWPRNPQTQNSL